MKPNSNELLFNESDVNTKINHLAKTIANDFSDEIKQGKFALIGIQTRGLTLAKRIWDIVEKETGKKVNLGTLGITLYRDDMDSFTQVDSPDKSHLIKPSEILFSLDEKVILLVDDVLHRGRTVRAALDEIIDYGRPAIIRLLVLVDRQGREFPIQADYRGFELQAKASDKVLVRFQENDGISGIELSHT